MGLVKQNILVCLIYLLLLLFIEYSEHYDVGRTPEWIKQHYSEMNLNKLFVDCWIGILMAVVVSVAQLAHSKECGINETYRNFPIREVCRRICWKNTSTPYRMYDHCEHDTEFSMTCECARHWLRDGPNGNCTIPDRECKEKWP